MKSILLIGTTQSGKSTFGNFLLGENIFKRGDSMNSMTTEVQNSVIKYKFNSDNIPDKVVNKIVNFESMINVIDTPGVGHADDNSVDNVMLNFYMYLFKNKDIEINQVFLIVKFRNLNDDAFLKNLNFYKKMFGQILTNKLVLIITNYKYDDEWEQEQRYETNREPFDMLKEMTDKIKSIYGNIPYFTINSLPIKQKDKEYSNQIRTQILNDLCNAKGFKIKNLKFPKITKWLIDDTRIVQGLRGEISGINETIIKYENEIKDLNRSLVEITSKLELRKQNINLIKNQLILIDNTEDKLILTQEYKDSWALFKWWGSQTINLNCQYRITSFDAVYGNSQYLVAKDCNISGVIYGYIFHNMSCFLNIYTSNKIYFVEQIKSYNNEIDKLTFEINYLFDSQNDSSTNINTKSDKVIDYKQKVEKLNNEISKLSREFFNDINEMTDYLFK